MRHYEIVFIVHPDQSEQVPAMVERYKGVIAPAAARCTASRISAPARLPDPEGAQGALRAHEHRVRQRDLAELEHSFKFSDAVLRHLIIKMDKAHTAPSPMMREEKSKSMMERGAEGRAGRSAD